MAGRPYTSSRSGRFQWMMQRVSAVLLLFLAGSHFFMQHYTSDAVSTGLTVAARMSNPWWQAYYVIFVVLALYHGVNGVMGIIFDYAPKALTRGIAGIVLWTLAAAWGVMGVANVLRARPVADVKVFYTEHGLSFGTTRGNPALAPAISYDFRSELRELHLFKHYLLRHTGGPAADIEEVFGTGSTISERGAAFDAWAIRAASQLPAVAERDRSKIFSSPAELALWSLNVRRANARARLEAGDALHGADPVVDQAIIDRLIDIPSFDPIAMH